MDNRDRRRVIVIGRLLQQCRAYRECLHRFRVHQARTAGDLVPVPVPRLLCTGIVKQPAVRGGDRAARFGQFVDETRIQCFGRTDLRPLRDHPERRFDADQPRQALRPAAARHQADLHFGETEHDARRIHGDAVVTGETDFEAATQRGAVDRRRNGLTAGLQLPQRLLHGTALTVQCLHIGIPGIAVDQAMQVGTGHECILAGRDDSAFDAVVVGDPFDRVCQVLEKALRHDVHRTPRHIDRQSYNTVLVELPVHRCHIRHRLYSATRSMIVAVPMPPPTQRLTRAVPSPRRSSSSRTVPSIIVPVAPSGCPIAIAPPLTLIRS